MHTIQFIFTKYGGKRGITGRDKKMKLGVVTSLFAGAVRKIG
jgi:hypothetical protein